MQSLVIVCVLLLGAGLLSEAAPASTKRPPPLAPKNNTLQFFKSLVGHWEGSCVQRAANNPDPSVTGGMCIMELDAPLMTYPIWFDITLKSGVLTYGYTQFATTVDMEGMGSWSVSGDYQEGSRVVVASTITAGKAYCFKTKTEGGSIAIRVALDKIGDQWVYTEEGQYVTETNEPVLNGTCPRATNVKIACDATYNYRCQATKTVKATV